MWISRFLVIGASVSHTVLGGPTSRQVLHERRSLDESWRRQHRLPSDTIMPMRIGLAQQNLHRTGEFLHKVSHPDSPDYGKHWTPEQVADAFASPNDTVTAIKKWLLHNGISTDRLSHHRNNWIEVEITTKEAEHLLRTEYFVHANKDDGRQKAACEEYYIPETLRGYIDFVTPTIHFDTDIERRIKRKQPNAASKKRSFPSTAGTTSYCPSCPPNTMNSSDPKTYLGSCVNFTTPACARSLYGIPDPSLIKPFVGGRVPVGVLEFAPAAQVPGDLSTFFAEYTNIPPATQPRTISINGGEPFPDPKNPNQALEPDGDFEIAMSIVHPNEVALYEIGSGATFNNFLDALDGSYCTSGGGDDPTGGDAGTPPSVCGSINGTNVPDVLSISWSDNEASYSPAYLQRQCNEYGKLGLMGVTVLAASGDYGVGYNCTDPSTGKINNNCPGIFNVQFPASCPYVTAVGMTRISAEHPFSPGELEVAPMEGNFTSGGGFSNVFAAPEWQLPTMQAYHTNHASSIIGSTGQSLYNNSGVARGFPDISANGYQFSIYLNGASTEFSGTSGSTPMVAGMIALINGQRLAQTPRKGTVGFINPVLYNNSHVLNDVVRGSNPGCGTTGFGTQVGWDPVTGLGTPNFEAMAKLWAGLP